MGSVKASPQTQLRLLELADLDTELARLDHRRRGLPEVAELAGLEAKAGELRDALVVTETALGDLDREQGRAERDVEQVRARIEKDRARLDAGQVSAARELASLQSEIENLHHRQGDLEEVVLGRQADVDVDAARARRLREAPQAVLVEHRAHAERDLAHLREGHVGLWIEVDAQLVRMIDVGCCPVVNGIMTTRNVQVPPAGIVDPVEQVFARIT